MKINANTDSNYPRKLPVVGKTIGILFIALLLDFILSNFIVLIVPSKSITEMATGLLDGLIAVVAAGLVLYELKVGQYQDSKMNDIQEATFLLEYNQSFIQDANMNFVEHQLENQMNYGLNEEIITEEHRQKFVNYLVYLEGLAPLILNGIMTFKHIDDLMAYRFFLAVNNPELQRKELEVFPEYYRGCFKLYRKWIEYYDMLNEQGIHRSMPYEETGLHKLACYDEYSKDDTQYL